MIVSNTFFLFEIYPLLKLLILFSQETKCLHRFNDFQRNEVMRSINKD